MTGRSPRLAAALLALAFATGCGPAGQLAPTPSPTASEGTALPTPTAAPAPTAAPTGSAPQPPVVPLPLPTAPPVTEITVVGPAARAGETYDMAIACSPPLLVWLDDRGDFDYGATGDGPGLACSERDALLLQLGVPGDVARPFSVIEADIDAPLIVRAAAGTGFGADAVAALAAAADVPLVTVRVSCQRSFEVSLGGQLGRCDPLQGMFAFLEPVTVEVALTELELPASYLGVVEIGRVE